MNSTIQTLSYPESEKLLSRLLVHADSKIELRNGIRNHCMALLMLDAGLRVGEVVKLTIDQLFYAEHPVGAITLTSEKSKEQRQRTIPVTIRLDSSIRVMSRFWWSDSFLSSRDFAFFSYRKQKHITTRQVERIINAAAHVALNRSVHPHILRHTFATRLMTKCPVRVVQQLLGHADLSSTQVYQHPNSQHLQDAIDTLNKTLE